jgi:leucyl aminopeptidase (aminopeptidase T)
MDLSCLAYDPDLQPGARNAVETCLRLDRSERVTLISDFAAREIAAALVHEIERIGSPYRAFMLEELAERPLRHGMPEEVLEDLSHSQVSIYAASAGEGELKARIQMTDVVNRHQLRHGHMVGITKQIMREGMRADFGQVDALSERLIARARAAREIRVTSLAGTELLGKFSPNLKWIKTSGLITTAKWGNLPGGEIFTAPQTVDGRFVVDGVVGDYLGPKYGDIGTTPLTIDVVDGRIVALECANRALLEEFRAYTTTDANSNRVGEFALGTNTAVRDVCGNILQDEKIPGVHMAFGHPYAQHTGADWASTTHIDCVGRHFDIWMDGEQVMRDGVYLV